MKIEVDSRALSEMSGDWLVIGLDERKTLGEPVALLDRELQGLLQRLIDNQDFTGKTGELVTIPGITGLEISRIALLGLGAPDKISPQNLLRCIVHSLRKITEKAVQRLVFHPWDMMTNHSLDPRRVAQIISQGVVMSGIGQGLYQATQKRFEVGELTLAISPDSNSQDLKKALLEGEIIGRGINVARTLINEPASRIFPESFADIAASIAQEHGMHCHVLDESELRQEKMEAVLAVGCSSDQPPCMVLLEHNPNRDQNPPLVLVGKGVTFDSGGLSLKTAEGMKTMKCDMSGAATVLGAMQAIAELNLPVRVIGLMGLAENMPSSKAMKVGDVIRARNGVTIEVLNTDAEGRLILADALSYAVDLGASHIVDLATLTGACVVALGDDVTGVMSNNQSWAEQVIRAAGEAGEPVWQLPLFEEYYELIRSQIADIKNIGGRAGGAITAGKFLEQFVGTTPWVHLDIAGPAFVEDSKIWGESGATGCMVATLVSLSSHFSHINN